MTLRIWPLLTMLALAALTGCQAAPAQAPAQSRPTVAADFTLPFHLVNGYILIDGQVNQTAGRFMFDTGAEFALLFNRHFVPLTKDVFIAQGQAGSGQPVVLYRQNVPVDAALTGGLRLDLPPGLPHADFGFLEKAISHQFLGMLGHGFNRHYEFALNYHDQTISFSALDGSGRVAPKRPPLVQMAFTPTGVGGKMPELQLDIGTQPLTAFFDTGNLGSLALRPETQAALERAGHLRVEPGAYINGEPTPYLRAALTGLSYRGVALAPVYNLHLTQAEHDRLGLGYQFLKNYVSVWNYRAKTVTLLQP